MKKHPKPGARDRARDLRINMTDAECKLWGMLRSRQLEGHKFRQVPIGAFIADFASHSARIVIEVDGGQHELESESELRRTQFIESEGYRVVRFWNNEVLSNPEGVYEVIVGALGGHHPHLASPIKGEGHEYSDEGGRDARRDASSR